jgi:tRNA modification GTPase
MLSDTIAALATPPGRSALAVVRLSGPDAFVVAARVVPTFTAMPPRTAHLAPFISGDGTLIDRGLYTVFQAEQLHRGRLSLNSPVTAVLVVPSAW